MYFDAAEAKIAELETRTAGLESAGGVDLAPIQADVEALQVAVAALQTSLSDVDTALTALDTRLDNIAAGAQG